MSGPDPSEEKAERILRREREREDPERAEREHSVFDEPAFRAASPETGPERPGYRSWLRRKVDEADPGRGWRLALLVMLAGGPWAVLGALLAAGGGPLAIVVWGPVAEEVMKVAILLTIVERRPYLFTGRAQIHLAAVGSGLGFAAIENLLYLNVYVPDPGPDLALWRWTVCVLLHTGASLVASLGIARMWRESLDRLERPRLPVALRTLVLAMILHGAYNGLALLLELTHFEF